MGRPPCCDKVGIKKGPWTPEEDIILVTYIQENGPGNWRSVPTNTGLLRCSKSCRLRWTNYLRPGIKRGNFTPHEEGIIIHLQALLGNKWAAIASYLPQRTDNDIKNYWNTHLKKKLKKFQSGLDPMAEDSSTTSHHQFVSESFSDRSRNLDFTNTNSSRLNHITTTTSTTTTYASSAENISRLLQGWMRSSPKPRSTNTNQNNMSTLQECNDQNGTSNSIVGPSCLLYYRPKAEQGNGGDIISHKEFESISSFENMNNVTWDKSTCDSITTSNTNKDCQDPVGDEKQDLGMEEKKQKLDKGANSNPPLSFLEQWLLDEGNTDQAEEATELSSLF